MAVVTSAVGVRRQFGGSSAAILHGAKWIGEDVPVELIWPNARPPRGVITRHDTVLADETQTMQRMTVTTVERTAFDLGRRGRLGDAVARLDALGAATGLKADDVRALAERHPHTRGLSQLQEALDLYDPGSQSPKETWLRLLLIKSGFPRPQTQIPVPGLNGTRCTTSTWVGKISRSRSNTTVCNMPMRSAMTSSATTTSPAWGGWSCGSRRGSGVRESSTESNANGTGWRQTP